MYITTFYSFKGGVGRTMALVNAAATLASAGRRVLVVDFDIEAPGLDTFDVLKPRKEVPGIIDFVTQYLVSNRAPDVSEFIGKCSPVGEQNGNLWIMPSGRNDTYAANFNQIDWGDLYERRDGFLLFEDLKAQWKEVLKPDYVLIDSRTGHTDTGGICTRQLPDAVVVLFFPNEQNLRGLVDVVGDIRSEAKGPRKKNIQLHFVMSNVPDLDDEDQILKYKINEFQDKLGFKQEPMTVHRYDSLSLLNQVVFSIDRPKSRLAKEYREIVREISVRNWNDRDGVLRYIQRSKRRRKQWKQMDDDSILKRERMLDRIEKAHPNDGEILFRLATLKESHHPESASSLINRALDAGYDKPEAYLKRSKIREEANDSRGVCEDIWHVLNSEHVHPTMVREAVFRLMRFENNSQEAVVKSPAVISLDHDDILWMAETLNRSTTDLLLATVLLERILNKNELSEDECNSIRFNLGMSYMGLGRCAEAAKMFRSEEENIEDLNINNAFNFAMAKWGETGTVQPKIFQHVLKHDRSDPSEDASPNYIQCLAIANWAVGDNNAALDCAKRAHQAILESPYLTEFSCWSYLEVKIESFDEDLEDIRKLIEKTGSILPKFMTLKEQQRINLDIV